jgi:hypothetical protein
MSLDHFRRLILARFGAQDAIGYSLGRFDSNDWAGLEAEVREWWKFYKAWERDDSIEDAFAQQRLTVKGTSKLDSPLEAKDPEVWGPTQKFEKPRKAVSKVAARFAANAEPEYYRIVKTNESIMQRLEPTMFVPGGGGESRKTEMGLHDLSAGLMNPKQPISEQQYKTPNRIQVYVFMPLSDAADQAVFQNINTLAKAYRQEHAAFYTLVRGIRSEMTRVKLAAEHDMATNFTVVGRTAGGRPKFRFGLLENTDVSVNDVKRKVIPADTDFAGRKVIQMATTPGILEARQRAALNYQQLVLGEMLRYGEVVVAYRQHAGGFPKFARFDPDRKVWNVYMTGAGRKVAESFPDYPVR